MHRMKWIRNVAVALAALVMAMPNVRVCADGPKPALPKTQRPIVDVSLTKGVLAGCVIDDSGTALNGATVVIKKGEIEITRTITDRNGQFTANEMKAGVYQVSSGNTDRVFRVWSEKTAPPVAIGRALMMVGKTDGRGLSGAEARRAIIHSKVDELKDVVAQLPNSN